MLWGHSHIADDLSRRVYVDALTSVRNKGGYKDYIGMLQERLDSGKVTEFAVCMFDCDDLKYINEKAENDWQHVNVSLGMAEYDVQTDSSPEDTAQRADERMYENKRRRKAGRGVR